MCSIYTAAQKFPFKIAKQASTMDPEIINFKVVYIHQLGQYASLLRVLSINRFQIFVYIFICSNVIYIS